ncbi:hypothetical protein EYR41_004819 [Orbilia oligospora]|uniref:DUF7708 domain-containing protein n=1 Tax=Orbilia oligospora TaxID=2813651 RepID=A0A8H2HR26_ORBOL|nr:hypothetical protein EYR41_004819 [Orbilia oligospora]
MSTTANIASKSGRVLFQDALTTFLDSLSLTDRQTLPANPSIKDIVDFVSNANRLNSKRKSRILESEFNLSSMLSISLPYGVVLNFFMTIAMAHNSYFEDVSFFLSEIGKLCPPIEKIQSLLREQELQDAICDFYSVIINLFTKLVAIFRKTGLRAYVKATIWSLKKEFEEFDAKLRQHRGYIDLYIKLASERAHYRERELQAHFRSQVIDYTTRDRNRWDASSNWAIQRDHEHMS